MTSKKQTSQSIQGKLIFSQGDSLVNHTATQEKERAKKMIDISGRKCLEQLVKLNQDGSLGKMLLESLVGMKGWSLKKCNLKWKLKGTKQQRLFFQLVPSVRRTEEIGFGSYQGLLPTVAAMDATGIKNLRKDAKISQYGFHSMSLTHFLAQNLLPTPTAPDQNRGKSDTISFFQKDGKSSQLNPQFTAEMMGFPPNWTELPFQNGEENQ